ncbi:MAG: hypothetical protein U9N61_09795 [Euryarchaeota archaeon]|nr:hypothetical protein [Euryarchaeota archaeon]
MSEIVQPEVQEIRVENNDIDLYIAYINEFRGKIDYQNELIREMNTNCTSWTVMDEEIE